MRYTIHMLSLFPQILFLAPAGTTLLRIAAAICFAYMAWYFWQERDRFNRLEAPIVGHIRPWMVAFGEVVTGIIAVLLFVGAWTQVAAIIGAIAVIKQLVFYRRYNQVYPFTQSTYWLLLCISLMLVVTGAGAFALDLPL
jgi:uncharacterized membrane protein YphA (DoxX/SURF4 family)